MVFLFTRQPFDPWKRIKRHVPHLDLDLVLHAGDESLQLGDAERLGVLLLLHLRQGVAVHLHNTPTHIN